MARLKHRLGEAVAALNELRRFDAARLLDWDAREEWPGPVRLIVMLALFALSWGLLFMLLIEPRRDERAIEEAVEQDLRREYSGKIARVDSMQSMQEVVNSLEQSLAARFTSPSSSRNESALVDDISRAGARVGLDVASLHLAQERSVAPLNEQPFELTLNGDYRALALFLTAIEQQRRSFVLEDFSFVPGEGAALSLDLRAVSYRLRDASGSHALLAGPLPATEADSPTARLGPHPARSPFSLSASAAGPADSEGVRAPDFEREREVLELHRLSELSVAGTLERGGDVCALIETASRDLFCVGIGDYLGRNHGQLTRVSSRELVLVELVEAGAGTWVERPRSLRPRSAPDPGEPLRGVGHE